jgi:hypothetical protein
LRDSHGAIAFSISLDTKKSGWVGRSSHFAATGVTVLARPATKVLQSYAFTAAPQASLLQAATAACTRMATSALRRSHRQEANECLDIFTGAGVPKCTDVGAIRLCDTNIVS